MLNLRPNYVYGIIDPANDDLIYIGKGSFRRDTSHALPSVYNRWKTNPLYIRIKEIIEDEKSMYKIVRFADGLTEDAALDLECELIQKEFNRGRFCKLTNTTAKRGRVYPMEERLRRSAMMSERMKRIHSSDDMSVKARMYSKNHKK